MSTHNHPETRRETCRTCGHYKPIAGGAYVPRRISRNGGAVLQFCCASCNEGREARMAELRAARSPA